MRPCARNEIGEEIVFQVHKDERVSLKQGCQLWRWMSDGSAIVSDWFKAKKGETDPKTRRIKPLKDAISHPNGIW